jgi:hypothetical protein
MRSGLPPALSLLPLVILTLVSDSLALLAEVLGFGPDYIQAQQRLLVEMLLASLRLEAAS